MRIGFGCTALARGLSHGGVDGIGSYTRELGRALSRIEQSAEMPELVPVSFGVPISEIFPGSIRPMLLPDYLQMLAASGLGFLPFPGNKKLKQKVELFHATDHFIPNFSGFPMVATIMDAIPLSDPAWVRTGLGAIKGKIFKHAAHWAEHVITISKYSKYEIVKRFGIQPEKITVTHLGVDERYFERFDSLQKAEAKERYQLPDQFYLFVGTLQPRKNVERILDAHAALPLQWQLEYPLVIVGRAGWRCDILVNRLKDEALARRVYWLNYVSDRDVRIFMQMAVALVFPSLCEGFGLPVVEAFASGLPVITSNTTALPEVAGEAALLVNPLEIGAICDAMKQIIETSGLAQKCITAGNSRARDLSWQACAIKTLSVYRQVLGKQ